MTIDPSATRLAAQGASFAPEIAAAAKRHRLDPDLLAAVAAQETGGPGSNAGHNIVGDGGHGHGIFQIDDRWHDFAKSPAAMDPAQNADYAAGMLSGLIGRYGGDVHAALSAYNAGSPNATGTTTQWADGQNLGYADSVMRHYGDLTGASTAEQSAAPAAAQLAMADLGATVSSVGSLASCAAAAPALPSPSQAPAQPQSYHRAATDYSVLFDGSDDD